MAHTLIDLHLSVWSPVLNSRDVTGKDVIEFSKKFEKLREALSCSVCNQLLTNREVLSPTKCKEHFVCKACMGKKRNDSRKCELCDDWNTFSVDEDLNDIIKSYQGFCFYFLTNPHIRRVLEVKQEVDPNFNPGKLIDLIAEGLKGLPIGEKRKLRSSLNVSRGVVPLDVPIKRKKTASKATAVDRDTLENELKTSLPDTNKEIKAKADAKKSLLETPTTQEKTPKIQSRALSEAKAVNKIPVLSSPSIKNLIPAVSTPPPTPRPECLVRTVPSTPEPIIASVRTPPPVQIKVEVPTPMTTPEKQHPSRNASPLSYAPNVSRTERIPPDPLEDPSRSQPRPFFTAPRPMVSTSFISSVSGTSTTPTVSYRFATPSIVSSQPSGGPQIIQIAHSTGIKTISIRPQQFRLAGVTGVPGGRLPLQILSTATTASGLPNPTPTTNSNIREGIITTSTAIGSSPGATKGKTRYLFTTANPHELQRWPDTSKILHLTANDISRFSTLANIRPGLFSVAPSALHQLQGLRVTSSSGTVRPAVVTSTTVSLVRPSNSVTAAATRCASPIGPTVSEMSSGTHGAPKYSPSTQVQFIRTMAPTSAASVGSVVQQQGFTTAAATITRQVPSSSSPSPSTANPIIQLKRKSEGCRCGNATPTPGKLTCIGQRCACYADRNACSDCKCKGCKNPYVPGSGGKKVLHGVRALIDPHTNQAIPIIATPIGPPGSCSATVTGLTSHQNVTSTSLPAALMSTIGHSGGYGPIQTGTTVPSSVAQPMPPFQLIPVRFGPSGVPQYIQISNPHALQQMPIILSSSGQLQTSSASGITIQGIPVSGFNNPGIHQMAQFQQQQQQPRISQVNVINERTPQHKD